MITYAASSAPAAAAASSTCSMVLSFSAGIGAEGDRTRSVAGLGALGAQQLGGVGFGEELGLEVEAGRKLQVGMPWPLVAVNAAVLAAAVGIDRRDKADVGRVVVREDRARA